MADLRESFPILEDSGTQEGQVLHKVLEGDAPAAKNALASLSFKDSSGNLVYPTLDSSGALPVTTEGSKVCKSERGETSGNAAFQDVATITLTNSASYEDLDWVVSCFRDCHFQIVTVFDVGGTDTEAILADVLVGAGDFTDSGRLKCETITAPGTGVNVLKIKARNLNALSDMRGTLTIGELA